MAARDDTPSIREITELTARLRRLTRAGRDADPAERAAFLADKRALLDRIETCNRTDSAVARAHDAVAELAGRRSADGSSDSRCDDAADDDAECSR